MTQDNSTHDQWIAEREAEIARFEEENRRYHAERKQEMDDLCDESKTWLEEAGYEY